MGADMAAVLSWRSSLFLLAAMSVALAAALWRLLPEPARGGRAKRLRTVLRLAAEAVAPVSFGLLVDRLGGGRGWGGAAGWGAPFSSCSFCCWATPCLWCGGGPPTPPAAPPRV